MTNEFWLTTLIIVASPGTGAIFTIATGLGHDVRLDPRSIRLHASRLLNFLPADRRQRI